MRAVIVAMLLLVPLAHAADANRSSTTFNADEPIDVLALAEDELWLFAGYADTSPANAPGIDDDKPVWQLWNGAAGGWTQTRSDTADATNCLTTPLTTTCIADVVAAAMSDGAVRNDGVRLAFGANTDSGEGLFHYFTTVVGFGATVDLPNDEELIDLDVTGDGAYVVVGSRVPAGSPFEEDIGRVRLYAWGDSTPVYTRDTDVPVQAVDTNHDGSRTLVAAHHLYSYNAIFNTRIDPTTAAANDVTTVAASNGAAQWGVAGYTTGDVNLYERNQITGDYERKVNQKPDSEAITVADIQASGGLYAAGDEDGVVRLFANGAVHLGAPSLVASMGPLGGSITDLAFSKDGRYLTVAAGNDVHLYRATVSGLQEYWKDTHSAAVEHVVISGDGAVVVAAVGATGYLYPPVDSLTITGPTGALAIEPGKTSETSIGFRNGGNRDVVIDLSASVPTNWGATFDPPQLVLAPGQTKASTMSLAAAPGHPAGAEEVGVNISTNLGEQTLGIDVNVLQKRTWTLVSADGVVSRAVDAGASTAYEVVVTNAGNAEDETTFTGTIDLDGWTHHVTPPTVRLEPNEVATVTVTLSAPADAKELETATLQLSTKADPDAAISVAATVGAHFGITFTAAPPGDALEPGDLAILDFVVTNTGNAPDSIRIQAEALPSGWKATYPDGLDPHTVFSVLPGASITVPVTLGVAELAEPASYQLRFRATSLGDTAATQAITFVVEVEEPAKSGGGKDSPGLPVVFLLAALASVAAARRFRP